MAPACVTYFVDGQPHSMHVMDPFVCSPWTFPFSFITSVHVIVNLDGTRALFIERPRTVI